MGVPEPYPDINLYPRNVSTDSILVQYSHRDYVSLTTGIFFSSTLVSAYKNIFLLHSCVSLFYGNYSVPPSGVLGRDVGDPSWRSDVSTLVYVKISNSGITHLLVTPYSTQDHPLGPVGRPVLPFPSHSPLYETTTHPTQILWTKRKHPRNKRKLDCLWTLIDYLRPRPGRRQWSQGLQGLGRRAHIKRPRVQSPR